MGSIFTLPLCDAPQCQYLWGREGAFIHTADVLVFTCDVPVFAGVAQGALFDLLALVARGLVLLGPMGLQQSERQFLADYHT